MPPMFVAFMDLPAKLFKHALAIYMSEPESRNNIAMGSSHCKAACKTTHSTQPILDWCVHLLFSAASDAALFFASSAITFSAAAAAYC